MNIAIVHDDLMRMGGAERVCLYFHNAFPDAKIFTLAYRENKTYPEFKECLIETSWYSHFVKNENQMKRFFFPFGLFAMQKLDLTQYDVVLMSTTYCAKYVKTSKDALVVCYCYTPFRLAWRPNSYELYEKSKGIKKFLIKSIVNMLKTIDYKFAQRPDYFIAMTQRTKKRLQKCYNPTNKIAVINPPVDCNQYNISEETKEFYLVVSRLEYYKRVDLVVDAFNELDKKLIIVGSGSLEKELKLRAKKNITFYKRVDSKQLKKLFSNCKAFIFPQEEDYGITPLEANASGRPVIAYKAGGILDTMIPLNDGEEPGTAILFESQSVESLIQAINQFELTEFDSKFLRDHALKYDKINFINEIQQYIEKIYYVHMRDDK